MAKIILQSELLSTPVTLETGHGPNPKTKWTLGRSESCDVCLDKWPTFGTRGRYLGREHAAIVWDEAIGVFRLVDTGSKSGSFLRGKRLEPGVYHALCDEEKFSLAGFDITVSYGEMDTLTCDLEECQDIEPAYSDDKIYAQSGWEFASQFLHWLTNAKTLPGIIVRVLAGLLIGFVGAVAIWGWLGN